MKELKDADDVSQFRIDVTPDIDFENDLTLEEVKKELHKGTSNDKVKFMLPEAYKTSLVMTINARSLQNFLELRTSSHALWEIQQLAREMFKALPEEHKYLFEEYVEDA